jgi:hypothetical protein
MEKNNCLYFGNGRRCINPELPVGLAGYFNVRMWDRVLDDLEVRALVLKSGKEFSAIIQYDLITVSPVIWDALLVRLKASGITELGAGNMIVTATHSHTAPEVRPTRGGFNSDYIPFVVTKTIEAIKDAMNSLAPGAVEKGMAFNREFIYNRRFWMDNGEVLTNPGKLNPAIVRPEGEIDPEIPLLAFKQEGKIKALIANIVNHTDTVGGCGVSADWPGFMARSLRDKLPAGCMVVPLIGCSGNINHFDVTTDRNQTCHAEAGRIGKGYAESIANSLETLRPMADATLKTFSLTISIPPRQLSSSEIEEAQAVIDKYPEVEVNKLGGPDLTAEDLARKTPYALKYFAVQLMEMTRKSEAKEFTLVRIDLGDAVIASAPCEPFVEIGLTIRKGIFGNRIAMVASLANGSGTGYIPNCWNYGRGGYETTPRSNPYSVETSELILAAWRKLGDMKG